jgi:hypothetical protein
LPGAQASHPDFPQWGGVELIAGDAAHRRMSPVQFMAPVFALDLPLRIRDFVVICIIDLFQIIWHKHSHIG